MFVCYLSYLENGIGTGEGKRERGGFVLYRWAGRYDLVVEMNDCIVEVSWEVDKEVGKEGLMD